MELHQIRANTLVEHSELGVGRIIEREGPKVRLRFNPDHEKVISMAEAHGEAYRALPEDGLEARFIKDPDEVCAWANSAPLRLIAVTLLDLPGKKGMPKQLQERLEGRIVQDVSWDTWWGKWVRQHAKDSGYFDMEVSRNPIELKVPVENVTKEPPARSASRSAQAGRQKSAAKRNSGSASVRELEAILEKQRESHAAEIKQLREGYAEDLALQRKHYEAELREQRQEHSEDSALQRQAFAKALEDRTDELERVKDGYESLLKGERSLVEGLRNQIAQRREESRLDIRRGMLEVMTETLKSLQSEEDTPPEALLRDTKAGLEIAILAGGAKWYGKQGEIVEFDPRLHDADQPLSRGQKVKVKTRGALVPGVRTEDFILMKAQVNQQNEV